MSTRYSSLKAIVCPSFVLSSRDGVTLKDSQFSSQLSYVNAFQLDNTEY